MKIIESIEEMREYSQQIKREGKTIASVNTAGDLHKGHMSLVNIGKDNADVIILSVSRIADYIYYNEEYEERIEKYKQNTLKTDIQLCYSQGVDIFCHYPDDSWNYEAPLDISIPALERLIVNRPKTRPAYLHGLCVWQQFFDIEKPDVTILGQKDIYQNLAVKSIIDDAALPIKVIIAPTIREFDGLAYSSGNKFLTLSERQDAVSIYQVLCEISKWPSYPSIAEIKKYIIDNVHVPYCCVDICCAETLEELHTIDRDAIVVILTFTGVGKFKNAIVELTDNIIIKPKFGEVDIRDNIIIKPNHNRTKMKIIESINEMREYSRQVKQIGKTIGLIDTEGDLHDGHMSLVKIAKENVDVAVLSICHTLDYFNFSTVEYEKYIKIYEQEFLEKDIELCKLNNVDVLFLPPMDDIYLDVPPLNVSIPTIDQLVIDRHDHPPTNMKFISGAKELYNIILPDVSVLGQKDAHQVFVLKSVIKQLDLPIKVITAPIIREPDGLAGSSRNRFLSPSQRQEATSIYQTLHEISRWSTYPSIVDIKKHITNRINQANGNIVHIDICCAETLKELDSINKKFIIIVNAKFGTVDYLIDNIIIEP